MLEKDTQSFLEFFAKIKNETSQATAKLEAAKKLRNDKTMKLRTINDQCAALQSKINKKIEQLGQYHIYKEFLDDLRSQSDKESMEMEKAKRLEAKRLARQANSVEPVGLPKRGGGRTDPSRSLPA